MFDAEGAMVYPDAHRPKSGDLLEVQRGMTGVRPEERKCPVRSFTNVSGKDPVTGPEIGRRAMNHNSVERPDS